MSDDVYYKVYINADKTDDSGKWRRISMLKLRAHLDINMR
jgi:hypothetical protein